MIRLVWSLVAIIVVLSWALVYYARDEWNLAEWHQQDEVEAPSRLSTENGRPTLNLPAAVQEASGIATASLRAVALEPELKVYGAVADLGPLLDARTRYFAAKAEADVVRAALAASNAEYERVSKLNRDDRNVSDRVVQTARASFRADQAKLVAAESQATHLAEAMRAQWGEVLAGWAAQKDSRSFARLLSRDEVLVQLAVPFDARIAADSAALNVAPLASPQNLRPAQFVSASPHADPAVVGRTFFYRVDGGDLRYGARLIGRIKLASDAREGVAVPPSAIVWHGGKSWIYLASGETQFERHEVNLKQEVANGWFTSDLKAGQQVAVSGAQLLLSEELKYQIRNENED